MSRVQVRVLIVLLVVVHVVFAALLTPVNLAAGDDPVRQRFYMMVIGVILAQPSLIALWAGLAPQAFLKRCSQALIALMCVELAVEFASAQNASVRSEPGEVLQPVAWLVAVAILQLPLGLLRKRYGWRVEPPETLACPPGEQSNQFSIRGIFKAMAVVAAFLAALRWLHPNSGAGEWGLHVMRFAGLGVMMSLPGALAVVVCWLVLMPGRGGRGRWLVATIGTFLVVGTAALVCAFGSPGELGELVFILLGALLSTAGSLFVVRLCGYRLVRRSRGSQAEIPTLASASAERRFALVLATLMLCLAELAAFAPSRVQLWRELAERRDWSDSGLFVSHSEGSVSSVSCNGGCRLAAATVDRINACSRLKSLDLSGSDADDETLTSLGNLPQLTHLNLCATRVGDAGVEQLGKFRALRILDLRMTDVTDDRLVILAGLKSLESVDLSHSRVTQAGVDWLKQANPVLGVKSGANDATFRDLANRLRDRRMRHSQGGVSEPPPLRFRATGAKVTDAGVAALRGMTRIEELDLTDAAVTDAAINDLATLTNLRRVIFRGTKVTDSGAAQLQLRLPDCQIVR